MGSSDLSSLLEECVQEMQAGVDLDQILARYPTYARELRPLLETAAWTKNVRDNIQIPVNAQSLSRRNFTSQPARRSRSAVRRFSLRLAFTFTAILLCLIFGLLGTTIASAETVPGDTLYPVKLAWEQIQINLTASTVQRLHLQQTFDQQRVAEVSKLINMGRSSTVTFSGLLVGSNHSWNVAGINLNVPEQQANKLQDLDNTVVQVTGETDAKSVKVDAIEPHLVTFNGQIQQLNSDHMQVSGVNVSLDQNTDIDGELSVNQQVQITAKEQENGDLVAIVVGGKHSASSTPTNLAMPASGETPGGQNSGSPEKTPQPTEKEAPMPTNGIQPMMTSPTPGGENEGPGNGSGNNVSATPTPGDSSQSGHDGEHPPTQTLTPTPSSNIESTMPASNPTKD